MKKTIEALEKLIQIKDETIKELEKQVQILKNQPPVNITYVSVPIPSVQAPFPFHQYHTYPVYTTIYNSIDNTTVPQYTLYNSNSNIVPINKAV